MGNYSKNLESTIYNSSSVPEYTIFDLSYLLLFLNYTFWLNVIFLKNQDKEIFEHIDKIHNARKSEGYLAFREIAYLRMSYFIYSENYRLLMNHSDNYFQNKDVAGSNTVALWRKQKVIILLIHNVLHGVQSYIERMNYDPTLQSGLKLVLKEPVSSFVRCLRNYLTHRGTFKLISIENHKIDNDIMVSEYFQSMDKGEFEHYLKEQGRNAKNTYARSALTYLEGLPEELSITEILKDFHTTVTQLHKTALMRCVKTKFKELHAFSISVSEIRLIAKAIQITSDEPITLSQERYLNYLLNKVII